MALSEALAGGLEAFAKSGDFNGALALLRDSSQEIDKTMSGAEARDALKKTTKDRLLLSFVDAAGFDVQPAGKALLAVEKLMGFQPGTYVLSKAWGLGTVKRLDYFYRRVTVDFRNRKGHQFSYQAAVEMLENAPEDHILVFREADPDAFAKLLADDPAGFVKAVLKSYGDMTATRLEDVCVANGFVKAVNWKKFWDRARAALRSDPLVEIPARKAEPIRARAAAEDYGDGWLTAFSHETDAARILALVREYDS